MRKAASTRMPVAEGGAAVKLIWSDDAPDLVSAVPAHLSAFQSGYKYGTAGEFEKAADLFREVVSIAPNYAAAHYNLGVVLHEAGQVAEAMAAFRKTIRLDPGFAAAHINLGVLLAELGQPRRAIPHFREAVRIREQAAGEALRFDPATAAQEYANAHLNYGLALNEIGQIAAAANHFREAIRIKPDLGQAHYNLGAALAKIDMRNAEKEHQFDESKSPGYTGDVMDDATARLEAVAADFGLPVNVAKQVLTAAASELTARENTARATATPRLKWETDRQADENPAHFAARAGYEHRGQIHEQDRPLSIKLSNWLRTHDWPDDVRYIPTKPEWNDRQVENLPQLRDDTVREVERLAAAARYRAAPRHHL